ncbi:MAG: hypothetical protein GY822_04160 [Deltaproteobacteria bacterium]|nr:hypothetical protein [Deltaproteobacteria bacterium]
MYLEVNVGGDTLGTRSRVYPALQSGTSNGSVDADYALFAGHADTATETEYAALADGNATGTFNVDKNGTASRITFDAQANDPGQIAHYENSNIAALWLDPSDDFHGTSTADKVVIGDFDSGKELFSVKGAGDGYFDRHLEGRQRSDRWRRFDSGVDRLWQLSRPHSWSHLYCR